MSVNDYLDNLTKSQQNHYKKIKTLVKEMVPDVDEVISYGMPTFKYSKKPLLYFGAFKNHMSLFPASGAVVAALGDKLAKYHTSKGTLQFSEENPIPDEVVKEIVRLRLKEISKA